MTHFKQGMVVMGIVVSLGALGVSSLSRADDAASGGAVDGAYGDLSKAYNKYFETLMTTPNKSSSSTSALANEILAPAQAGVARAMWDNSADAFTKEGIGLSNAKLSKKDLDIEKKLPPVVDSKPMKGYENIGMAGYSSGPSLKDAEMAPVSGDLQGQYAKSRDEGTPVVVDGSQFQRELTFPGGPAVKAQKTVSRKPASDIK